MKYLLILAGLICTASAAEDWGPVQFLIGHWTGEGSGAPGQGGGAFSFAPDLQGKVLIRKSFAEYPASGSAPAIRHEDLTIVYREGGRLRAIYFDGEGHVIRYGVQAAPGGVVFESDAAPPEVRYRLTYTRSAKDRVQIKFEIAAPGKSFATYIEASARREDPARNSVEEARP